jgi:hypothetical protein
MARNAEQLTRKIYEAGSASRMETNRRREQIEERESTMSTLAKLALALLITVGTVALDELVRSNIRKEIKKRFFNDGAGVADEEIHSGCCGGSCC